MASASGETVNPSMKKTGKRKKNTRVMLGNPDSEMASVKPGVERSKAIIDEFCEYVKQFPDRYEVEQHLCLGFNRISSRIEKYDENIKAVLLNEHVSAPVLVQQLGQLCLAKKVPVCSLEGFEKITETLRPMLKGLKNNIVGLAILSRCDETFVKNFIDLLPKVEPPSRKLHRRFKRIKPITPKKPDFKFGKHHIRIEDIPVIAREPAPPSPDIIIGFHQPAIVNFENSIGSQRPIEMNEVSMPHSEVDASVYKKMKIEVR